MTFAPDDDVMTCQAGIDRTGYKHSRARAINRHACVRSRCTIQVQHVYNG